MINPYKSFVGKRYERGLVENLRVNEDNIEKGLLKKKMQWCDLSMPVQRSVNRCTHCLNKIQEISCETIYWVFKNDQGHGVIYSVR